MSPQSGTIPNAKNRTSVARVHLSFSLNPSLFSVGFDTSGILLAIELMMFCMVFVSPEGLLFLVCFASRLLDLDVAACFLDFGYRFWRCHLDCYHELLCGLAR